MGKKPPDQHRGATVIGREQDEGSTSEQRLLAPPASTDWLHTDTWRVLRIQAEFVEGFAGWSRLTSR